jgi:GTP pyrophosphokinase
VIGPEGKQVEIQIRTYEMHHTAEFGIASHWLYKETDKSKAGKVRIKQKDKTYLEKLSWLRKFTEEALDDGKEFLDTLKTDVLFEEVYVFSPKGDIYSLPQGATPVDFAYLVHTEVGNHCYGAKVNGKIVPLDTELQNGDVIEILTRNDVKPNSDWLSFVKGNRTKSKIKAWITHQSKEDHLATGRKLLEEALKELLLDFNELLKPKYLEPVLKRYTFENEEDLFIGIGHGDVAARAVARYMLDLYKEKNNLPPEEIHASVSQQPQAKAKKTNSIGVGVAGMDTIMIRLANCCHPLPGDAITGFVTMGYGITVHRVNCHNIQSIKERRIEVFWNNTVTHRYSSLIEVVGFDRVGIFKDLLNVIADKNTNILEATAKKTGQGEFKAHITVEINDLSHLLKILDALKKVKDVYDAYRIAV